MHLQELVFPRTMAIGRSQKQTAGRHVTAKGFCLSMRVDKAMP